MMTAFFPYKNKNSGIWKSTFRCFLRLKKSRMSGRFNSANTESWLKAGAVQAFFFPGLPRKPAGAWKNFWVTVPAIKPDWVGTDGEPPGYLSLQPLTFRVKCSPDRQISNRIFLQFLFLSLPFLLVWEADGQVYKQERNGLYVTAQMQNHCPQATGTWIQTRPGCQSFPISPNA